MKLKLIFLACHVVHAHHGNGRPLNLSKKEIIKICYNSLMKSIEFANFKNNVDITVVGDKLDDEMIEFFSKTTNKIINENLGMNLVYKKLLDEAIKEDNDTWIYFCEDDYLHKKEAILYITDFIQNNYFDKNFCIFTQDYKHRYQSWDKYYLGQHYLLLSKYCWWRQIRNITLSYLIKARDIRNNIDIFNNTAKFVSDAYLSENLFWTNKITCFSPIPTLTVHMHESEFPSFIEISDVKKIIDEVRQGEIE